MPHTDGFVSLAKILEPHFTAFCGMQPNVASSKRTLLAPVKSYENYHIFVPRMLDIRAPVMCRSVLKFVCFCGVLQASEDLSRILCRIISSNVLKRHEMLDAQSASNQSRTNFLRDDDGKRLTPFVLLRVGIATRSVSSAAAACIPDGMLAPPSTVCVGTAGIRSPVTGNGS